MQLLAKRMNKPATRNTSSRGGRGGRGGRGVTQVGSASLCVHVSVCVFVSIVLLLEEFKRDVIVAYKRAYEEGLTSRVQSGGSGMSGVI